MLILIHSDRDIESDHHRTDYQPWTAHRHDPAQRVTFAHGLTDFYRISCAQRFSHCNAIGDRHRVSNCLGFTDSNGYRTGTAGFYRCASV